MQNARVLVSFLVRAVVVGLAVAFLVVWWKPALLGAPTMSAQSPQPAPAAAPAATPSPEPAAPAASDRPIVMQSFADSVARAAPAVVNIYTRRVVTERMQQTPLSQLFGDYWPSYRQRIQRSLGSGVIVDAKGTIVTNVHVIAGADSIQISLADGRVADAAIVGQDPDTDIAILGLKLTKLPVMPLGRSDTLRVGDIVLAIGNPYGLSQTVTQGIVSATGRGQLGLATFENFIQTDAAINLGNSGGALIDARGDLVGINTAVLNRQYGGPEGIGFAIPVNLVRGVMQQILEHGHVIRGWLGFIPQDLTDDQATRVGAAVVVANVLVGSPADDAGIRPNDLITRLNGVDVRSAQDLVSRLAALKPGVDVQLEGRRGQNQFKSKLKVVERPTRSLQRQLPG
ncbi:MAG TPA: trypsin-like peptidase domain-containing protein [Steroidobacteraceae bacterium]